MHSAARMFALVNDVKRYPEFLDGCAKVDVIESSLTAMTARQALQVKLAHKANQVTTEATAVTAVMVVVLMHVVDWII